jgi:general secretion pathway protein H
MKGFTLIELLIVIVLIGVMSTMAMLSMGSGDQRNWQRQEAERLLQLIELAAQESIIQGTPVAVELFGGGYRFMFEENDKWHLEVPDAIFRARALHPQLFLELELDEKAVFLNRKESVLPNPEPQIVFTPDGDINSFEIKIGLIGSDETFTVMNTPESGLLMTVKADTSKP